MTEREVLVDGVEPDREMAARAADAGYRRVLCEEIESAAPKLRSEGSRYDVILLLDVLEHLVDPEGALGAMRELTATGGRALISLPNIAHWSVRKQLVLGRWDYQDSGLLDRTHLHFFTADTALQLVEAAGWRITWEGWSLDRPPLIRLPPSRLRHLARWPRLFGVQMLLEARPGNR